MILQTLYKRLLTFEARYWLYRLRHPTAIKRLRTRVNPSAKGDFSLRNYDKYQCIFVHITKSAGTSIAKSLFTDLPYHYSASQYRVIYGRKTFNQYYRFTFVRNPWDRLYSAYSYLIDGGWDEKDKQWSEQNLSGITDFNDFVIRWLTPERLNSHIHFWPQSRFICDSSGRPIINDIFYFESIQQDFKTITKKLGSDAELIHTNKSKRNSYKDAYTEESIEKVRSLYTTDISNFGYTFDGLERKTITDGRFITS